MNNTFLQAKQTLSSKLSQDYDSLPEGTNGSSGFLVTKKDLGDLINQACVYVVNFRKWTDVFRIKTATIAQEHVDAGYISIPIESDSPEYSNLRVDNKSFTYVVYKNYQDALEQGTNDNIYSYADKSFWINNLEVGQKVVVTARGEFLDLTTDDGVLPFTDTYEENGSLIISPKRSIKNDLIVEYAVAIAYKEKKFDRFREGRAKEQEVKQELSQLYQTDAYNTNVGSRGTSLFNTDYLQDKKY